LAAAWLCCSLATISAGGLRPVTVDEGKDEEEEATRHEDQKQMLVNRLPGHEDREQLMVKRLPGQKDWEHLMCCV
jgi:hypothetical protein